MAGVFFTAGEAKKRAGVYQRYEKTGAAAFAGASNGIVAAIISCNWGEINKVVEIETVAQVAEHFGTSGNTFVIEEAIKGGASLVRVVRVGNESGSKATATLNDTDSTPAIAVTAKHMGTRAFSYAVRNVIGDSTAMEFVLLDAGKIIEKIQFLTEGGVANLINAAKSSKYMDFALVGEYSATGKKLAATGEVRMTAGTNPTVTNTDYSTALTALEPHRWNTLCVDSNDVAVHALVSAYMTRVYQNGKTGMAVLGEPISQPLATRMDHAAAFNDYKVVYVGGGWYDTSDNLIDGFRAAARIAGMIAYIPANQSITHNVISTASRPAEMLTNSQFEQSIDKGMITFAQSPSGNVWIESGINTLVALTGEDDEGWKKIKRTKIRFEVMDRVNDSVAPLIGTINNDEDGRATVIQTVKGVLNAMVAETKLMAGASVEVDPSNAPVGDSAWFVIVADDIDSLEKVYFTYKFRFASNS